MSVVQAILHNIPDDAGQVGTRVLTAGESLKTHLSLLILARRHGVHIGDTEEMGICGNQEVSLFGQACSEIKPIVVGKRIALGVVASSQLSGVHSQWYGDSKEPQVSLRLDGGAGNLKSYFVFRR